MAEPSASPALSSTADTTPYVPVSWMAVAAGVVAAMFLVLLLSLGMSAFRDRKPLIMPELLLLPAVGIVLSFAARRLIRNSEGTRTGMLWRTDLVNSSWWVCVVGLLGYSTYLFAIEYSIRRDAETQVQRWVGHVQDDEFNQALIQMLEPARRAGIRSDDKDKLQAEFRNEYLLFSQCDLVQLARRNKGQCEFVPGGLKNWTYKPTGIDCVFTGALKCPEGVFPLSINLKGVEGVSTAEGGSRQWFVNPPPSGFFKEPEVTRTPYGWLVFALQQQGGQVGRNFISPMMQDPGMLPYLYHGMIRSAGDTFWHNLAGQVPARVALLGGLGATTAYTSDFTAYMTNQFLKLPGGGEPTKEQRAAFLAGISTLGMTNPGGRIPNSIDKFDIIVLTDTAVQVFVPCELPLIGHDISGAARGRLVVTCTDPAVLAELKQLRSSANPSESTLLPSDELRRRQFRWNVVRLETDLYPVRPPQTAEGRGMPPGGAPPARTP